MEIKLRKNILSVSNQRHFLGGPNMTQTKRKKLFCFIESNNYVLSVQIKNKNWNKKSIMKFIDQLKEVYSLRKLDITVEATQCYHIECYHINPLGAIQIKLVCFS